MKKVSTIPQNIPDDAKFDRSRAAAYLGLSVATLAQDVVTARHKIPYLKIGRRCVYVKSQLDAWLDTHAVNAPAAPTETVSA